MILPFSTQLNGKPTLFPEKIWQSFPDDFTIEHFDNFAAGFEAIGYNFNSDAVDLRPKLHTVRQDLKGRWDADKIIDFFLNNRMPNMFRFAPRIPCKGIQDILMTYEYNDLIKISIDDRQLYKYSEREEFAYNDGFNSWEDFFNYWHPIITQHKHNAYNGIVLHWTDFRY